MVEASINIKDNRQRFIVGQSVQGTVGVTVPNDVTIREVDISFHCLGEVKWVEYPGTPYYLNGFVYYDKYSYLDMQYSIPATISETFKTNKQVAIPFEFVIPTDKGLPSTMVSTHGFIQYFVKVAIRINDDEIKKFVKEVIVESPIEENLMITVGSTAEKNVLLHVGKVIMHASIGRKGFAPGETINVHVSVENKSTANVQPRVTLHQTQIYMCGSRHKTIETNLNHEPAVGSQVDAHSDSEQVLSVQIPSDESLTIKSSVITVKYFVHVTLNIPHSFDLHINLPIILTSPRVIERYRDQKDQQDLTITSKN